MNGELSITPHNLIKTRLTQPFPTILFPYPAMREDTIVTAGDTVGFQRLYDGGCGVTNLESFRASHSTGLSHPFLH
jgi:hypothetical protein